MNNVSNRLSRLASALLVALAFVGTAARADAATSTANLSVTATVNASCSITTSAVAFGSYDPVGSNAVTALSASGSVIVTCTTGALSTVTLGQGANAGAGSTDSSPSRRMTDGSGDYLSYALFQDALHVLPWGNTALTGKANLGTGASQHLGVYGSIPAGQNVPSGSYADTVVATVTF